MPGPHNSKYMGTAGTGEKKESILHLGQHEGRDTMIQGVKWTVRDGFSISLWFDNWIGPGPLRNLIAGPLTQEEFTLSVSNLRETNGPWALHNLFVT